MLMIKRRLDEPEILGRQSPCHAMSFHMGQPRLPDADEIYIRDATLKLKLYKSSKVPIETPSVCDEVDPTQAHQGCSSLEVSF